MKIWGIHKTYKTMSWWENFMGGHINIGHTTIFGDNAMCWTLQIHTKKWGYICITLPSLKRWRMNRQRPGAWPFYIYCSPNGTPWACTFYRGGNKKEVIRAQIRKLNFGHNFNTDIYSDKLRYLNNKFDSFVITDYDLSKYNLED